MANSKIYLGNTNIGSLFQGADDISIYLGENKVYPLEEPVFKWKATYSDSSVTSAECGSSSEIVMDEINLTNLVSVEIGDCVTSIGRQVFEYCSSLTSIDIPDSVESIGSEAFYRCSGLTSVNIPSGVTSIGNRAFYVCSNLASITVNATTPPALGFRAFDGSTCPIYVPCESVNAYKSASGWSDYASRIQAIPNSCPKFYAKYSGGETYRLECDGNTTLTNSNTKPRGYQISAMTEAIIGDYCVTSIGSEAFYNCRSLTSVNIPSGVTSIGTNAFSRCSGITSIDIPNSVTSIGNYAFDNCTSLTSVTIGSGVTSIGNNAFYHCSGFTNLDIPDSVTTIGDSTFNGCSGLTSVTIGSGVTTIGDRTFQGCRSLTNIDIPDSVTSIGAQTFSICNSLTNVTIGSGVTSINEGAFANNSKLSSVTCFAATPPTLGTQCFYNTPNSLIIYVPSASLTAYQTAWSDYASRIQAIP